ncbi:MAG: hypothetical protein ACRDN0_29940 [Trebonia sp.]
MFVELRLNVPWLSEEAISVGDLSVGRGNDSALTHGALSVPVHMLDPALFLTVEPLIFAAQRADSPSKLVIVAGHVPVVWRGALREAGVSFACDDGVVEVTWPRRITPSPRLTLTLAREEALLAQELVIAAVAGQSPTCRELGDWTRTSADDVLAVAAKFAEHGLVRLAGQPSGSRVTVTNVTALADALAHRTAWPGSHKVVGGYAWGRNIWAIATLVSRNAAAAGIDVAVTGRAAAAFHGVVGPASRSEVWCWVSAEGRSLKTIATELRLEPVPWDDANVLVAADPYGIGTSRRGSADSGQWTATVAHPLRVWCDLHHEDRGLDLTGKIWPRVSGQ